MEKKVYSTSGKELRTITLDDKVFGLPVNDDVIYYAITNELANRRVGTACTKTRAEVHGSNNKLWYNFWTKTKRFQLFNSKERKKTCNEVNLERTCSGRQTYSY